MPGATLLYDGDCPLCARSARELALFDLTGRLRLLDLRTADLSALPARLTREECASKLRLVEDDGKVRSGFEAVRRLTSLLPALWWAAPAFYCPGARLALEPLYGLIERLRFILSDH